MEFASYSVFAALLLIFPSVLSQDAKYVYEAETECMAEFPSITRDYMESLKQARKLPDSPTQDFKCFLNCIGKKLEAMSDLEFMLDMLKTIIFDITGGGVPDEEVHESVTKCIGQAVTADECEISWEFVDCIATEIKDYKLHHTFCPTCKHD